MWQQRGGNHQTGWSVIRKCYLMPQITVRAVIWHKNLELEIESDGVLVIRFLFWLTVVSLNVTWMPQCSKALLPFQEDRAIKRSSPRDGSRNMTETCLFFRLPALNSAEHLWDEAVQDNHSTKISQLTKICRKWSILSNRRRVKSLWNIPNTLINSCLKAFNVFGSQKQMFPGCETI